MSGERLGQIYPDFVMNNLMGNRPQVLPDAGTGNASPCVYNKQCAVIGALDKCSAIVQKLVLLPFEGNIGMRAEVAIEIYLFALAHAE